MDDELYAGKIYLTDGKIVLKKSGKETQVFDRAEDLMAYFARFVMEYDPEECEDEDDEMKSFKEKLLEDYYQKQKRDRMEYDQMRHEYHSLKEYYEKQQQQMYDRYEKQWWIK